MNKLISKTIIFLGILCLIGGNLISFGATIGYAEDLEITGNDIGLEVIPGSARLFDLSNLNPGDTKEAKLTIKNNYIATFELLMRTERMSSIPSSEDVDLFGHLTLTIFLGDKEVYSGSMRDFATSNISIGKFAPGDMETLVARVHLPGLETGNEYQGSKVEVKWIFIAQLEEAFLDLEDPGYDEDFLDSEDEVKDPILPKTGEISPMALYGIGTLLLGLGIGIGRKKRK